MCTMGVCGSTSLLAALIFGRPDIRAHPGRGKRVKVAPALGTLGTSEAAVGGDCGKPRARGAGEIPSAGGTNIYAVPVETYQKR